MSNPKLSAETLESIRIENQGCRYPHIDALLAHCAVVEAERRDAEKWIADTEEREAAVCPEDTAFDDYIKTLTARLREVEQLNKTQAETIADYQAHVERLAIGAINSYHRRAVEAIRARIDQRNAHVPRVQVDEIQERLREDREEDEAVIRLLESLPATEESK